MIFYFMAWYDVILIRNYIYIINCNYFIKELIKDNFYKNNIEYYARL